MTKDQMIFVPGEVLQFSHRIDLITDLMHIHYVAKSICLLALTHRHINLSDFLFWIHRVKYDASPPFAAIPASVLLGRFSTRFRNVFMGIFWPFFEMCICEDRHWCWTWPGSQSLLFFISIEFYQVEIRTLQLISSITSSLPNVSMDHTLCTAVQL